MPEYPIQLSGLEPQIGGILNKSDLTGFEPSLGGNHRFDMRIWLKLIDPRWPYKETLIAGLSPESCQLYAKVLVQVLPEGASFSQVLEGGAALGGHYGSGQRAAAAYALGLIGMRLGTMLGLSLVTSLLQRLSPAEDEVVRVEAARALGLLADQRAEMPLIKAMSAGEWRFRLAVIRALGQVGTDEALRYLISLHEHSESLNETKLTLESLGILGGRLGGAAQSRVHELLMRVFVRSDSLQRGAAAHALGYLGDRRALDLLIQVALNGRGELQCAAVEALGILGDAEAVAPLIFVLTSAGYLARQDAVNALIRMGQAAVAPALAVLRHPDKEIRCGVIEVLGKVGAQAAVKPLIDLVKDSAVEVRQAAVNALGLIGDPQSVEALIGALNDSEAKVRKEAAMMLGGFRDARAVGPLCIALWDADMTVRWFAAYALGLHGDPRAVRPLIQATGDRAPNVVQTATDSLVRLGDVAVPELARQVFDATGVRRAVLLTILNQIGSMSAAEALMPIMANSGGGH